MNEISEKLYNLMVERKMSYGELSKSTGLSKSCLQRYMTGETAKIPISRLEIIANALGTSAAYILGWAETASAKTDTDAETERKPIFHNGDRLDAEIIRLLSEIPTKKKIEAINYLSYLAASAKEEKYQLAAARGNSSLEIPAMDKAELPEDDTVIDGL